MGLWPMGCWSCGLQSCLFGENLLSPSKVREAIYPTMEGEYVRVVVLEGKNVRGGTSISLSVVVTLVVSLTVFDTLKPHSAVVWRLLPDPTLLGDKALGASRGTSGPSTIRSSFLGNDLRCKHVKKRRWPPFFLSSVTTVSDLSVFKV